MPAKKKPIERKKVYIFFVAINVLMAVIRTFLFVGQPFIFHLILTVISFLCLVIVWEFILIVGPWLEKKIPQTTKLYLKVIIQVLMTYSLCLFLANFLMYMIKVVYNLAPPPTMIVFGFLLTFLLSIILNFIYFGTIYFNEWKENLVRTAVLQQEKAQVKYDGLRNQLNPHFLFNALTSLNSLIFENQQLASDFLQQLAKVYRYTLQNKEQESVSLKTELDFIDNYIQLFKTRFENSIRFKIEIAEEAKEKGIVPVTLQMLIENAAKHNIISESSPLLISITANTEYIIVENSVNKKARVETSNKQGLNNLKTLYHYLSDKPFEIIETEKLFTVKIPLLEK